MKKINVNENVENEENGKIDDVTYVYDLDFLKGSREGMLARELATGLNDMKSVRYYFGIAHEHSEQYIREVYRKVMETPAHRIKRSRGALFVYLIKKYDRFDTFD